ncbi:aminotransferase class V-fold PLP-dependent enzyme [bacterium]|nr:aminotransferase class V-fold PLP-dependent enzyme [bacterium]
MIYLDNAATTLHKPSQTVRAIAEALNTFGNSSRGTHSVSLSAAFSVYEARVKIAEFFNCPKPEYAAFTLNATHALNIAINGLLKEGDHVISTDWEHNSVLRPLYRLEAERQVSLSFLKADSKGRTDFLSIPEYITPKTRAVICTHASNVTGNMADLEMIGEIARRHGLLFIVDASQSAGFADIDMQKMNIDVLCYTGHKGLMGPQGTGGICLREPLDIRPFYCGGTGVQSHNQRQPEQLPTLLEAGTLNSHGLAGLSASLDFIKEIGLENIRAKEKQLAELFLKQVKDCESVTIYGDFESAQRAPLISLNIGDLPSGTAADILALQYDIAVRPGIHCAPRIHEALGTAERGAVRFSFSYLNTEAEVMQAAQAVKEIAEA